MNKTIIIGIALTIISPLPIKAQQAISLEEAQRIALDHYPSMRAARLDAQSAEALKKSALDLGETEISTGGEEIGPGNEATYTLIAVRQNLDILSIGAKRRNLNQQARVAEAEAQVAERELRREVGIDYVVAIVARERVNVYQHLDSIYRGFEHAAQLRYETEASSKLEYISARQQARQAQLALDEARRDERIALQNLNRWLGEGADYRADTQWSVDRLVVAENDHPSIVLAREKVRLAETQLKAEKAEWLPKLYVQGGTQKIGAQMGFWTYEVGVSMPLFSARSAKAKAGRLQQEAEKARQEHTRQQLDNELRRLTEMDEKWSYQLRYYRETALPLADEQQRVALASYKEGAIGYIDFIQNMKEAAKEQLDYWTACEEYMTNKMNLLYY